MSRKGENIRKRSDGRWEGRYKCVYGGKTEQRYRSVYAKTYREVKEKLLRCKTATQEMAHEMTSADHEKILFGNAAREWLSEVRETRKYSTYIKYLSVYEKHLAASLENCSLDQITDGVLDVQSLSHTSASIQRSAYCVANQIISFSRRKYGVQAQRLACAAAKPKGKPVKTINHTDQSKLTAYLYQGMDLQKLGIMLCLFSGLRLGEVCALKWEDIDLQQNLIHVRHTVQRIKSEDGKRKTRLMETAPKSEFSEREIPIPASAVRFMKQFQERTGYFLGGDKPMKPRTYQNRFKAYLKKAGATDYNFHALRHTFATNCAEFGVDTKSLSELLGHSDVQTTLKKYVHPRLDTKRRYMEELWDKYGQKSGQAS